MFRSYSAVVSPLPRSLMDRSPLSVVALFNKTVEALRRVENVPQGEGAEAWRRFMEHFEATKSQSVARNASERAPT